MTTIQKLVLELNKLNRQNKMAQEEYKYQKDFFENKIRNYLYKKNQKEIAFDTSGLKYKATDVKPKKINFDVDLVQQRLDKELFNEICIKKYQIIDYEGMVAYLKSLSASPKEFKKFIHCEKTIDQKMIDELGQLGDLTLDDLEGCYTITENSGYIKITVKDASDEEDSD